MRGCGQPEAVYHRGGLREVRLVGGSITADIDIADGYSDIGLAMGTEQMNLGQMHDYRTIIPLLLFIE